VQSHVLHRLKERLDAFEPSITNLLIQYAFTGIYERGALTENNIAIDKSKTMFVKQYFDKLKEHIGDFNK